MKVGINPKSDALIIDYDAGLFDEYIFRILPDGCVGELS